MRAASNIIFIVLLSLFISDRAGGVHSYVANVHHNVSSTFVPLVVYTYSARAKSQAHYHLPWNCVIFWMSLLLSWCIYKAQLRFHYQSNAQLAEQLCSSSRLTHSPCAVVYTFLSLKQTRPRKLSVSCTHPQSVFSLFLSLQVLWQVGLVVLSVSVCDVLSLLWRSHTHTPWPRWWCCFLSFLSAVAAPIATLAVDEENLTTIWSNSLEHRHMLVLISTKLCSEFTLDLFCFGNLFMLFTKVIITKNIFNIKTFNFSKLRYCASLSCKTINFISNVVNVSIL